jgi:hypothetical protein
MAADDKSVRAKNWRDRLARFWQKCLDLALVLWIVRVPLCALILGFLILYCTPQAQDLFTEFADHRGRIVLFLVLAFVWAATTHYASRLLLDTDTRFRAYARTRGSDFLASVEKWVPRVFGLVPFGLVLIASARSIWNLPDIEDAAKIAAVKSTLYVFDALVVAVGAAFFAYMVNRQALMETGPVKRAEEKASVVNPLLQRIGLGGDGEVEPGLGPLPLIAVSISAIIIFRARIAQLPRAPILPIILGGWLPLLTFLSALGRQLRAPLIVGAALVIAGLSAILGDNHSVRRIDANALVNRPVDKSAIQLNQALDLWMKENDCAGKPASCPRPVIVAARRKLRWIYGEVMADCSTRRTHVTRAARPWMPARCAGGFSRFPPCRVARPGLRWLLPRSRALARRRSNLVPIASRISGTEMKSQTGRIASKH